MTTFDDSLAARIKALREDARLSVRDVADRMQLSSSGYARYEQPTRNKRRYLPAEVAEKLARALQDRGVSRARVLALTRPPEGLGEPDAAPWNPPEGDNVTLDIMRRIAPTARTPFAYELRRSHPSLALLRGDVLVIDSGAPPQDGDLVVVTMHDGTPGCLIRRWHRPLLISHEPDDPAPVIELADDDQSLAIHGPVLAMFRPSRPRTITALLARP